MARGIATVWVPVTDMKRATAFYRDVLDLQLKNESEDWTEFDANGLMIGLNAREEVREPTTGGAVLTFQPDGSIEDELANLQAHGATISGEISRHDWGRILPFKDSEGNDIQFYSPPQQ